jgi:hypothetical protein
MPILFLSHSGSDTEAARLLKKRIEDSPGANETIAREPLAMNRCRRQGAWTPSRNSLSGGVEQNR